MSKILAKDIMTSQVVTVHPEDDMEKVAQRRGKAFRLPLALERLSGRLRITTRVQPAPTDLAVAIEGGRPL